MRQYREVSSATAARCGPRGVYVFKVLPRCSSSEDADAERQIQENALAEPQADGYAETPAVCSNLERRACWSSFESCLTFGCSEASTSTLSTAPCSQRSAERLSRAAGARKRSDNCRWCLRRVVC
ncbi:uncharacterized protein LOC125756653 [Rhipicephalus sanguineus]|uniref:uncharacterized protein LOC125756653 n=1 Tax=Rhipicephalus sanguineus TaxID=34632 RepID=UPI0020C22C76|nr:uncharacterized protein LOC125756653 [Rhipicephalus sanguineus]